MTPRTTPASGTHVARRVIAAVTATALASTVPAVAYAGTVPPSCGDLAVRQPIPIPWARTSPAGPMLRGLAGNLSMEPADFQTGRYTRTSVILSAAATTAGACVVTRAAYARQLRWRDELTNSGTITGTPWFTDVVHPPLPTTRWYGPGGLPGVILTVFAGPTRTA